VWHRAKDRADAGQASKRSPDRGLTSARALQPLPKASIVRGSLLVIALIAAVLGFGGIAGFAVEIAKIIFFVAIILFVISAVFALIRGRSPTIP